ncbi:MAG TPA: NAD(P)H-hydrate dehydratase [Polyangiaceae bacterium]|nr:NAD(P)H-hydrate dehydratase [Polyangiaceae bacterium]
MLRVFSRAQMREFDRSATSVANVPSVVLMENAGRGAADIIAAELGLTWPAPSSGFSIPPRVCVVCGLGNNAGDGYVVARRLSLLGASVKVFALHPEARLQGDALTNLRAFVNTAGAFELITPENLESLERALDGCQLVVDAIFGTGLDRAVSGIEREAIARINRCRARRVALDLPSGLDADTGKVHGETVRAELTITFAAPKLGLLTPNALGYRGRLRVTDIGVGPSALPAVAHSAALIEAEDVRNWLGQRAADAHKSSSGRVLILAGSAGKVGAALLVAQGALRAGAGLVTLGALPEVASALDQRVLEAMTARLDPSSLDETLGALLASAQAVAIGPGLGFDDSAQRLVQRVVLEHAGKVVVDADAISHFAEKPERLAQAKGQLVLTPHPAELARLLGGSAADVEADRFGALERAVRLTKATVLLKGPHTLIGSEGQVPLVNRAGTPALATGGAGDVLTGVIAALCCRLSPLEAASSGAFLHALSGELWAAERGADRGLLAHEIADGIPRALAELSGDSALLPV